PGTLVPLPVGATSPTALVVNPAATRLYVVNNASNNVTVFPLAASGDVAGAGTNTATGGTCGLGAAINATAPRPSAAGAPPARGPAAGAGRVSRRGAAGDAGGGGAAGARRGARPGAGRAAPPRETPRLYVTQTTSGTVAVLPLTAAGDAAGPAASTPTGGVNP